MTLIRRIITILLRILGWLIKILIVVAVIFSVWAYLRENDDRRATAPNTGAYIRADDIDMFVQTTGATSGPPILLIHGMGSWSETWRPVMEMLAGEGYFVVAADMPPFGFSERPKSGDVWRIEQSRRLVALMDAFAIEQAVIVGHSYGSRAVLEAAMRYPERVSGLVLVDPALGVIHKSEEAHATSSQPLSFIIRYPAVAMTMTNPLFTRKMLQKFVYDSNDITDEILAVYRMPANLKYSTRDLGAWLRGFLTGADDAGLSVVETHYTHLPPTALIWGEKDTVTPLAQGEALNRLIATSTIIVMPGVGHLPQIEDTSAFNDALKKALEFVTQ